MVLCIQAFPPSPSYHHSHRVAELVVVPVLVVVNIFASSLATSVAIRVYLYEASDRLCHRGPGVSTWLPAPQ